MSIMLSNRSAGSRLSLRRWHCHGPVNEFQEKRLFTGACLAVNRRKKLAENELGSFLLGQSLRRGCFDYTLCRLSGSPLICKPHKLEQIQWPPAVMSSCVFRTKRCSRRSFQLTFLCGVLLSNVRVQATTAEGNISQAGAINGDRRLGDRDLQTTCARDLIAVLSGGVEAGAVATPRADALRSCLRPLVGQLPGSAFQELVVSETLESQKLTSEESVERQNLYDSWKERTGGRVGLRGPTSPHLEYFDGYSFRKLLSDLSEGQLKRRGRHRTLRRRRLGQDNPAGLAERFGSLVVRPPPEVMALVRALDTERGNGSALQRALGPSQFNFPDCEGSTEARCQLARAPTGQRFSKQVVSRYFALLFEAVAAAAPAAGMPIALSRFDLFHGHFFYARDSRRFGILFHAREYPAEDPEAFPVNLGYCQRGSTVRYDATMNLRNILWLAPREAAAAHARAPGVLCALDTRPDGILGKELVAEGLQLVHTVYEG